MAGSSSTPPTTPPDADAEPGVTPRYLDEARANSGAWAIPGQIGSSVLTPAPRGKYLLVTSAFSAWRSCFVWWIPMTPFFQLAHVVDKGRPREKSITRGGKGSRGLRCAIPFTDEFSLASLCCYIDHCVPPLSDVPYHFAFPSQPSLIASPSPVSNPAARLVTPPSQPKVENTKQRSKTCRCCLAHSLHYCCSHILP